jgi:glycosyltransferase involved in cell wall biosynthesis
MKLLVFAHTPPPVHGQSVMVQTLIDGLRGDPELEILHVNARLSQDNADVGRPRAGKVLPLLKFTFRAWSLRARHGHAAFYYVPAPGENRSALYRDFVVMLLCRPFFSALVLHWHAAGLGHWLLRHAHPMERILARWLLGGADLSIVLGENLRSDAEILRSKRTTIVRNGLSDPCPGFSRNTVRRESFKAIFVGICSRAKGVIAAALGVVEANRLAGSSPNRSINFVAAGNFNDEVTAREFRAIADASAGAVRHAGFLTGRAKHDLFAQADVLIFPTQYAHETQGLVVVEALAFDLPVITTRWRAVHEGLPKQHIHYVEPNRFDQIADALLIIRTAEPPNGALRAHFLARLTREHHIIALKAALRVLTPPRSAH